MVQEWAASMAEGIRFKYFLDDILFHPDYSITFDLINFIFRFLPFEKRHDGFDALNLLLTSVVGTRNIERALSDISKGLRLDFFPLALPLLPGHFFQERELCEHFASQYFERLRHLDCSQTNTNRNNPNQTSAHFLFLFSLLHRIDASKELFVLWGFRSHTGRAPAGKPGLLRDLCAPDAAQEGGWGEDRRVDRRHR